MLVIKNYWILIYFVTNLLKILCYTFRAAGGHRPLEDKFSKYVASIRHAKLDERNFGSGHMCGGTIIGPKLILTAAHCLYPLVIEKDSRKSPLHIVVGTIFRTKYIHGRTQIFKAADFLLHPLYDYFNEFYDIGLVWTHRSIDIDGVSTDIMKLPDQGPRAGMHCLAAGWGEIYYKGPLPDEIIFINIYILKEKDCWKDYPGKSVNDICATNIRDITADTCKGDSGGPLFCNGQLYGVTSRGIRCGKFNRSGLYSNVYKYVNWIEKNNANKVQYSILKYISFIQFVHFVFFWFFH